MHARSIPLAALSVAALVATLPAVADVDLQVTHAGDTHPLDEGWQGLDIVASSTNSYDFRSRPTVGPGTHNGIDFWRIRDDNDAQNYTSAYRQYVSTSENLLNSHWRASAHVRGLPSDPAFDSQLALNGAFRVSTFHYTIVGAVSRSLNWTVAITDEHLEMAGSAGHGGAAINQALDDGFHWVELLYDPDNFVYTAGGIYQHSGAALYLDGVLVQDNVPIGLTTNQPTDFQFGDLQQVGNGWGGADWAHVDFTRDDEPLGLLVPEPATLGLLLAALPLTRRRRHTAR